MATYNGHQEDSEGNILLPTPHSYAPIELGTTASQAYTKGKLMVYNNRLCQAKTSISSGATLTIGTNIEYTDMDTQLNNVKVYVGGSDSKLHFVDHTGADTALNFNPIQTGGTYNATSRGSSLDMGQRNTYRYVNTSKVPNSYTRTILWENPNPSASFGEQGVTFEQWLSYNDFIEIEYIKARTGEKDIYIIQPIFELAGVIKRGDGYLRDVARDNQDDVWIVSRHVQFSSTWGANVRNINFSDVSDGGKGYTLYNYNYCAIPTKITWLRPPEK